jgi:hypothetical protein
MSHKQTQRMYGLQIFSDAAEHQESLAVSGNQPARRRRLGLRAAALCLGVAIVAAPVVASLEFGHTIATAHEHAVANTIQKEQLRRAEIRAIAASGTITEVGHPHDPAELAVATGQANGAGEAAAMAVLGEELLAGMGGVALAGTASAGMWRRRQSIAGGARRMAHAVARTVHHAWEVLNEPIGEPMPLAYSALTEPTLILPHYRSPDTPDLFDGTLQPNIRPSGLDPALAVGF